ncbi:hypothetical protein VB777_10260 [Synechococcus sp. CCY9202]|nr:hypothetical protein [Synechococcus sp. CCY9202]
MALIRCSRSLPLATRAVYTFARFPDAPVRHLILHHDGYPTGAAWRFAAALRQGGNASTFLAAFVSSQPGAAPLAGADQAADADYRYLLTLVGRHVPRLQVECWRRLPGATSWQRRCGPMLLATFIQRFLPGDPLPMGSQPLPAACIMRTET